LLNPSQLLQMYAFIIDNVNIIYFKKIRTILMKLLSGNKFFRNSGLLTVLAIFCYLGITSCRFNNNPQPPVAKIYPHIIDFNGDTRTDNYFWLRYQDNREVSKYIAAENKYTNNIMSRTEALQEKLIKEFRNRTSDETYELVRETQNYIYYKKCRNGEQYATHYRKRVDNDKSEEVILDEKLLAKGYTYFKIGAVEISPDESKLAYCIDTLGIESYSIMIKDLAGRKMQADFIQGTSNFFKWANDNRTLYYCLLDSVTSRPYKVFKHIINTEYKKDELVYHEKNEAYTVNVLKSKSNNYIFLIMENNLTTEYYYLDADTPDGKFKIISPRQTNHQYYVEDDGQKNFYILTNDKAENFRIMEAPVSCPSRDKWKEVIPHRLEIKIEKMDIFRNHIALFEREKGLLRIKIINKTTKSVRQVMFSEPVYTIKYSENDDFNTSYNTDINTNILRFVYTSLTSPMTLYEYNMDLDSRQLKKQLDISQNYNKSLYSTERLFAQAEDGTQIPVSIVYKKGMVRNGDNPLLMFSYGAYGISNDPRYFNEVISLLDRGFIYAIPHIRGGGEMGDYWYEQGRELSKKNSFTDLISCAEYLIRNKYTSASKLVLSGRSAGGMTIGAVLNMRPDLFRAVVTEVPFVDVLNTMLDDALPLTIGEKSEWGDPGIKSSYDYIKSYSPYDNVRRQKYPEMLVIASLNDKRVCYWEPLKWVAKLRATKEDQNLLLLRINTDCGHSGSSGRYNLFKNEAFKYAFILNCLGIEK